MDLLKTDKKVTFSLSQLSLCRLPVPIPATIPCPVVGIDPAGYFVPEDLLKQALCHESVGASRETMLFFLDQLLCLQLIGLRF